MSRKIRRGVAITTIVTLVIAIAVVAIYVSYRRPKRIDTNLFADDALRSYVADKVDSNHDGNLSSDEAANVCVLVLDGVQNLSGLSAFPNLQTVIASGDCLLSAEIENTPSLSRLDLSGATNLTSLVIVNALDLRNVDIRGTGLTSVDLSKAGHVTQVLSDPTTKVTGLSEANKHQESLPTHYVGINNGDQAYSIGDFTVDASYDGLGRLEERALSGDVQALVSYEYGGGDGERLLKNVTVNGSSEALNRTWQLSYSTGAVNASGDDSSFVNRSYNSGGQLVAVSLDTFGTEGVIQGTIEFQYDARGFLSGATVMTDGVTKTYTIGSNGAGQVETVSTDDAAAFISFNGSSIAVSGTTSSQGTTVGRITSNGSFSGSLSRDGYGNTTRLVGTYGSYTPEDTGDGQYHQWGKVASPDSTVQYTYDIDYEGYDVPADLSSVEAVSLLDKTAPSPYVDYWFVDDMDTVLGLAIQEAASNQWSLGSTDPVVAEVYDSETQEQYEGSLDDISKELGIAKDDMLYYLVSPSYSKKPLLLVVDSGNREAVAGIYGIVNDEVALIDRPEDGATMCLCGGGFLRKTDADGNETVSYFTGVSFDDVASVRGGVYHNILTGIDKADDGTANSELESTFPSAMDSLSWEHE